nr:MAG TPA: hypothetical protein [Caudoviricetes sp.]
MEIVGDFDKGINARFSFSRFPLGDKALRDAQISCK